MLPAVIQDLAGLKLQMQVTVEVQTLKKKISEYFESKNAVDSANTVGPQG